MPNQAKVLWYDKDHSMGMMKVNDVRCRMGSEMVYGRRKDGGASQWMAVTVYRAANPSGTFRVSAATAKTLERKIERYEHRLMRFA